MSGSLFGRRARICRTLLASGLAGATAALTVGPAGAAGIAAAPAAAAPTAAAPTTVAPAAVALVPDTTAAPADDIEPSTSPVKMQTFDPADFADQAAGLPAGLVHAVERDLGMSPEEYLASAAAASRAGDVVAYLGDAVRAAWLEGQVLHVAVADQAHVRKARATGAEVRVGDALSDALAAARAQDKVAYIDREADSVIPLDVDFQGEPVGKPRLLARSDWRGGSGFAISDLLMDYHCSTGFNGVDAGGNPRVLTAGHCGSGDDGLLTSAVRHLDPPAPIWGEGDLADTWPEYIGEEIGEYATDSFVFGGGRDAGLIDVTNDEWDVLPEVASSAASSDAPRLRVYDSIDAVAGAPACSSGVTSGWTCGQILDAQATVPVSGQDVTGFIFDACVLPGDSGGAVVVGNYAVGVNSGSTWRGPTCTEDDPAGNISLGYAVSGGDDNAESLYADDWELLVHVGRPVVTSPGDDSTVGPRPTLSGTAAAAAGATVTVSIDDGPTLEGHVTPSGRWKVSADETLPPGTYTYEATVSHTTVTGSTTTTSGTTTGSFRVAEVADLGVSWPEPGDTTTTGRPTFEGTGQPGATLTLTVDERERATTTVDRDGTWSLTPDDGLRAGRFDAVLTQRVEDSSDAITVADVGVLPEPPVVTSPRSGDDVGPSHTITGVGIVGAAVSVTVRGADGDSSTADAPIRVQTDAEGIWEIELDGPLVDGEQTVVATQAVDDLESEPESVTFEVTRAQARTAGQVGRDDDDLAGTGASANTLLVAAAFLLAIGASAAAVGWRRRLTS